MTFRLPVNIIKPLYDEIPFTITHFRLTFPGASQAQAGLLGDTMIANIHIAI